MHLYVRVISRDTPETYSEEEVQSLQAKLASAPGIEKIKKVQRHPRGGYSIEVESQPESPEKFAAYLASHGYSLAI